MKNSKRTRNVSQFYSNPARKCYFQQNTLILHIHVAESYSLDIKIHPAFHVSLIKPYRGTRSQQYQPISLVAFSDQPEVLILLAYGINNEVNEYLII